MSKFQNYLKTFEQWFLENQRILPWRDNPSVYRVWISEIMLQQTGVKAVLAYFEKFIERFPNLEALAQAKEEEVFQYWAGLGYYTRAKNLHKAARLIHEKGEFPKTQLEWLALPGVGRYTAGAILSIALNQAEAILDANVERVLSRIHRVDRQKGDARYKARLWRWAQFWVQTGVKTNVQARNLNQAFMELGSSLCQIKVQKCHLCPLQGLCQAQLHAEIELYPPKKARKKWIQVSEKMHCIMNPLAQVLLRKRGPLEWRAGLWDLLEELPSPLPRVLSRDLKRLGSVQTKHVVTRHQIKRETWIYKSPLSHSELWSQLLAKTQNETQAKFCWVNLHEPKLPVGSALKRSLKAVLSKVG